MNRKQAGIGLGVGVAAFVGLIALSGQYVPPTGPLQTIQSLIVKAGFTNQGPLVESGVIRPTGVTGTLDNWAPTGIATASTVYATLSGDATLTSIAASQVDGRVLRLCASGGFTLTLDDAASTGTAANKLALAGGIDWLLTSGDNRCVTLRYDGTATRWKADSTSMPKCENGERLEYADGTWRCRRLFDYRNKTYCVANDYLSAAAAIGDQGIWTSSSNGTGASNSIAATAFRGSLITAQTGTTNTGRAGYVSGAWVLPGAYASATFEATAGIPTLSTGSEEFSHIIGAFDVITSPTQSNGCGVLYDRGNVATGGANSGNANVWECFCAAGGTRTYYRMNGSDVSDGSFTTVNTPVSAASVATDANMIRFRMVWTGTSLFEVYADTGAGFTKRCQITSNIAGSTAPLRIGHNSIKSAGSTDTAASYSDQEQFCWTLNAARSPRRPTFKPGDRRHKSIVRPRHVLNDNAVPMRAAI